MFLGRWTQRLAPLLLDFAKFPGTGPLIDVGCGTGSLARAMAVRWPARAVIGVDRAAPYIAFARAQPRLAHVPAKARPGLDPGWTPVRRQEHAQMKESRACSDSEGTEHALDNPAFAEADAAKLPYADASFDGAAAQLMLNFVPDPIAALNEMKRVTVPGGRLAAAIWDFRGGLVYQRIFWDTAAGLDPQAAIVRDRLYSGTLALPDGLVRLFEHCGLDRVERTSLTIRMDYASFDDYWAPLLGGQGPVGIYVAALSADLRTRIEAAVRAAYLSGAPEGPRSLTASAWAVRGVVPRRKRK